MMNLLFSLSSLSFLGGGIFSCDSVWPTPLPGKPFGRGDFLLWQCLTHPLPGKPHAHPQPVYSSVKLTTSPGSVWTEGDTLVQGLAGTKRPACISYKDNEDNYGLFLSSEVFLV